MKTAFPTTILGALLALASQAQAAPTQVEVHGRALPAMTRTAFDAFRGAYRMQDGSTLAVARSGARLTAEWGRDAPVDIVPVSDREFEARDGRLTLRFDVHANGDVTGVTLTRR